MRALVGIAILVAATGGAFLAARSVHLDRLSLVSDAPLTIIDGDAELATIPPNIEIAVHECRDTK